MDCSRGMAARCWVTLLLGALWATATLGDLGSSSSKIDFHAHYYPPFYPELYIKHGIRLAGGHLPPVSNMTAHLEMNKMIGVSKSVLSVSTPGAKFFKDEPNEVGRQLARRINEQLSNVTAEYPENFVFLATLTLPDIEGAVEEAIYAMDTLKAVGVYAEASTFGTVFGTPLYAPLYKLLDDRKAIVFVHPNDFPCPSCGDEIEAPGTGKIHPFVAEFLMDTTRAAANLVHHKVLKEYPNIKFILAHSGGYLPFSAYRSAAGLCILAREPLHKTPLFLQELQKFYVEVAVSASPFALPSTTAFFDSSHILFGTDYPLSPVPAIMQNTMGLRGFQINGDCSGADLFPYGFTTPCAFAEE